MFTIPRKALSKTGAVYMLICSLMVSHVTPFSPMSARHVWKTNSDMCISKFQWEKNKLKTVKVLTTELLGSIWSHHVY